MTMLRVKNAQILLISLVSAFFLGGCGMLGAGGISAVPDKDFVADVRAEVDGLKGNYVILKGMLDAVKQKAEELTYVPDGLRLRGVKWKDFHRQLSACWDAPIEQAKNAEKRAIELAAAAKGFGAAGNRLDLKPVQDSVFNAVNKVQVCPQALEDEIKGTNKRTKETVKAWARDRVAMVSDIKVILSSDLPERAKAFAKSILAGPAKIALIVTEANVYKATLEKIGTQEQRDSLVQQLAQIEKLKAELAEMKKTVASDATNIPDEIVTFAASIKDNLASVGKKK